MEYFLPANSFIFFSLPPYSLGLFAPELLEGLLLEPWLFSSWPGRSWSPTLDSLQQMVGPRVGKLDCEINGSGRHTEVDN